MNKNEDRIEKTGAIASISDNKESIAPLAEILKKLEERSNKEIIPILERIENNTSFLSKQSRQTDAPQGKVAAAVSKMPVATARPATEEDLSAPKQKRITKVSDVAVAPPETAEVPQADALAPQMATAHTTPKPKQEHPVRQAPAHIPPGQAPAVVELPGERDNRGRFVGKSKSQEAQAEQKEADEKKSFFESMKGGMGKVLSAAGGFASAEKGTIEEAAGRAAGGPIYEAAMEVKEAFDSVRDEDSMIGKAARWAGRKTGILKAGDEKEKDEADTARYEKTQAAPPEAATDAANTEIVDALESADVEDERRHKELVKAIRQGDKRTAGPGARERRDRRRRGARQGTATAPAGGGDGPGMPIAGGAGMLKTILSKFALPVVGVIGAGLAGAAVGTGVSRGVDRLTEKASGGKYKTGGEALHATINPESKGLRQIIGDVESGKRGYSAYQNRDSGIVSAGKYQFTAAGGESSSLAKVLDSYVQGGGARAEEAQRYSAAIKSGKAESLRHDGGFRSFIEQTGTDKAMQQAQEQVFDQQYFNPAIGYAQKQGINAVKMPKLAAMMVDTKIQGGMEDVTQRTRARLATQGKDFKTASEDEIMDVFVEERKNRLDRIAANKAAKGDTASAQMLASSKGRVDKVRLALDANEKSLREGAHDVAVAAAKERARPAESATSLATGGAPKGTPERMTTAIARSDSAASPAAPNQEAAGSGANGVLAAAIAKLGAGIAKISGRDEAKQTAGGASPIRTEFDDTMLTLMAYDRV